MHIIRRNIPFLTGGGIFIIALVWMSIKTLGINDGMLFYTLDDPYIHMAIAKNFAEYGVFGVTRFCFSSCTSSPLWTLLLSAFYKLSGTNDWLPGVLATVFALWALYSTQVLARLLGARIFAQFLAVIAVAYLTPLIPVISTGMEHTMHLCFIITFLAAVVRFVEKPSIKTLAPTCILAFMSVGARYESIFMVLPICVVLIICKQPRGALATFIAAVLPIVLYGLFSVHNGSYFLPNSLILKGNFPSVDSFKSLLMLLGYRGFDVLINTPHLLLLTIMLALGIADRKQGKLPRLIALSLIIAIIAHLQFASVGWFFRYEAYIIAASIPVIAGLHCGRFSGTDFLSIKLENIISSLGLIACVVILVWPLHLRAMGSLREVLPASNHIYCQQFRMADFTRKMYPPEVSIALNDLGAVSYYTDARILDLWGLGNIEVMQAKRKGQFDTQEMRRLLAKHNVEVVMVYSHWFRGECDLPDNLIWIANWTVANNYHDKTVSFFATTDKGAKLLRKRLLRYQSELPKSVSVDYAENS